MSTDDKKRLEAIRAHHTSIKKVEARFLDFKDRISRNALLEYVEGVDTLLACIDEKDAALRFYANPKHYENTYNGCGDPDCCAQGVVWTDVAKDEGAKAREALGEEDV